MEAFVSKFGIQLIPYGKMNSFLSKGTVAHVSWRDILSRGSFIFTRGYIDYSTSQLLPTSGRVTIKTTIR